jgi:hypothetical protein
MRPGRVRLISAPRPARQRLYSAALDGPDLAMASTLAEVFAERRLDRRIGLMIVAAAFAIALGVSYWAKIASRPEVSQPPGPPTTEGIAGYPEATDPVKTLAAARRLTKRRLLRGFDAEGGRSDGTVELSDGPGRARNSCQSDPGDGPQPPREPGTLPRRPYCGRQNVHLRREGLVADPDLAGYPCPPQHTDALPEPRCTARDVWRHALHDGAPRDRLARIEYYRARSGPAWRFEIPGTPHHFNLYGDCGRLLEGSEAVGSVP